MLPKIYVTQPSMPAFEEYVKEIKDLWSSKMLTNMGVKHEELELELKKYLNIDNISLLANGHLALETVIAALGLSGEVITAPFSFASTTHAIVRCGLTPVFCDINYDDYTINADKIEALITPQTSAILAVHVYGNICNVEKIQQIADHYHLKVIYDAAHAFGVLVNGASIAGFGDASMFSFHATKVFHTIEGGAVACRDRNLKLMVDRLKNFGITGQDSVGYVGGNAKMNEFQAAMGICNLRHISEVRLKRKAVYEQYQKNLSCIQGIYFSTPGKNVVSNYAYVPVRFEHFRDNRERVVDKLVAENIFPRKYFYPLISNYECYQGQYRSENIPVAEDVAENVLTLPMYAELELGEVDRICSIITDM